MANFILLIIEITSARSRVSTESALHDCMTLHRGLEVAIMTRPLDFVPHFNDKRVLVHSADPHAQLLYESVTRGH